MSKTNALGIRDEDDEDEDSEGITELEKIAPTRVDGVSTPASGLPFLMLFKSLPAGPASGGSAMAEDTTQPEAVPPQTPDAPTPQAPETPAVAAKGKRKRKAKGEGSEPAGVESGAPSDDDDADGGEDKAEKQAEAEPDPLAAVKFASAEDRAAYLQALAEHRAQEPVGKGAATGTEYLQAKRDWHLWNAAGEENGLTGTAEGAALWLAKNGRGAIPAAAEADSAQVEKRDMDPDVGGGVDRDKLPAGDFAGKNRSFPIVTPQDVKDAARSLGRAGDDNYDEATLKANIIRIARRKGPKFAAKLPKAWRKKDKAAKSASPVDALRAQLADGVAKGLITQDVADGFLAQAQAAAKANVRDLPKDVKPAGKHREPDGTTTVEPFEHDAHMGTDPDKTADKVPASVAAMGKEQALKMMHDAVCAAYRPRDVAKAYGLDSLAGALDPGWFSRQAGERVSAGKLGKATTRLIALARMCEAVKNASPETFDGARDHLSKAFRDMYPNVRLKPKDAPKPGQFHRPYLSTGHAAESAGDWTENIPESSNTPEPGEFGRGYLTAGHAAPSPADHSPHMPPDATGGTRQYYTQAEKDMAEMAMRSVHDHIAANAAGMCPMAPSRAVMPPGMGAEHKPRTSLPKDMGGINTVKEAAVEDPQARKVAERALKEARRAARAAKVRKGAKGGFDARAVEALAAEKVEAATAQLRTQLDTLLKQVDELGKQPDPAMAPVRGQLARAGSGTANPVEKRSLIDEAQQARALAKAAEERNFAEYVQQFTKSDTPGMREAAQAVLDQLASGGAYVPA